MASGDPELYQGTRLTYSSFGWAVGCFGGWARRWFGLRCGSRPVWRVVWPNHPSQPLAYYCDRHLPAWLRPRRWQVPRELGGTGPSVPNA
jgi:hypothetical protein